MLKTIKSNYLLKKHFLIMRGQLHNEELNDLY
jgi:hypothetical protein